MLGQIVLKTLAGHCQTKADQVEIVIPGCL
jgi:hypothetical protein